jgi:hypothetical protein
LPLPTWQLFIGVRQTLVFGSFSLSISRRPTDIRTNVLTIAGVISSHDYFHIQLDCWYLNIMLAFITTSFNATIYDKFLQFCVLPLRQLI